MASRSYVRNFAEPDELIQVDLIRSAQVSLGGISAARTTHQPGWRWSTHLKEKMGTESCQTRHVGLVLSGRIHVVLDSGPEFVIGPGDVYQIPPGHDAWVEGDEPCESIEWAGTKTWLPHVEAPTERILATILFTDIVGSTSLARSLGDLKWADLISTHEERIRDVLPRFGGREIKPTGDGVLAIFNGAGRALRCAAAMRQIANDLDLEVRTALHTGEIDLAGSDIRGIAINEASRMLALAGPNEILVSATVRNLLAESDFRFDDRGDHQLRGLTGTRHLYAFQVET